MQRTLGKFIIALSKVQYPLPLVPKKNDASILFIFQVKFYESAGFSVVGPSPIVHGADQWIEMVLELPAEEV